MEEQMKIDNDEVEIDLMELVHVLLRNAWVIVLCTVVSAVLVGIVNVVVLTPQYQASSMIYVLSKTTSITSALDLQLSQQLTTDFETLALSRPVVEKVIDDLQLDYEYEEMLGIVTVENPDATSILRIVVTNPDPELAAEISNAMADTVASRIAEVMITDKPSKVEDAVVPVKPVTPHKVKNTALGGLLGAFAAAALIILLHLMDDTIKSEEDVKKYLGAETLAAIPLEKKKGHKVS